MEYLVENQYYPALCNYQNIGTLYFNNTAVFNMFESNF